jgi:hypothetical protein
MITNDRLPITNEPESFPGDLKNKPHQAHKLHNRKSLCVPGVVIKAHTGKFTGKQYI